MSAGVVVFGKFELHSDQRLVFHDGTPVRLGSRALDLLIALTARPGRTLSKEELIAAAWPNTFVDEANLRVNVAALRRALASFEPGEYITNVPGRGYGFAMPVIRRSATAPVPPPPMPPEPAPFPSFVIGRAEDIEASCANLPMSRLLTLVGPGGVGKTTVASAIVHRIGGRYRDGVANLDLALINDPKLLPPALGSLVGYSGGAADVVQDLSAFLRERQMLVVLDNCEHLIEAVAELAEELLSIAHDVHILATSREPLRVAGERVRRLGTLASPPESQVLNADEALTFPAVELFVRRAADMMGEFKLSDEDAPVVAAICRRLDGIPLAIELGVAKLEMLGVQGLATSLDAGFRVLTRGRRTALPRHQTLRATLDWSFDTLSPGEQAVFRRLSVFRGGFSLPTAVSVLTGSGLDSEAVEDALTTLVDKSLVGTEFVEDTSARRTVRYRLLETTWAYAREKIVAAGETDAASRQHANYYVHLLHKAANEIDVKAAQNWQAVFGRELGNLRAAVAWSRENSEAAELYVALVIASVPLLVQLSLIDELLGNVQTAIAHTERHPDAASKRDQMQLLAVLGWPQMSTISAPRGSADSWRMTLALAEEIDDVDYQLRALLALWFDRANAGEPRQALDIANQFQTIASRAGIASDMSIGWRLRARAHHLIGDQQQALTEVRRFLETYEPLGRSDIPRFHYDQEITARTTYGRALWVHGLPDQAMAEIENNIDEARQRGHTLSICQSLSDGGCAVALACGDLDKAEQFAAALKASTNLASLDIFQTYADFYIGAIHARKGSLEAGALQMRLAIDRLAKAGLDAYSSMFVATLARHLVTIGQWQAAIEMIDNMITQCDRTGESWFVPELHRTRGEALRQRGGARALEEAERSYRTAIAMAGRQQALAWELRAATSLAELRAGQKRGGEALDIVRPVYERFSEGFDTADLKAARALIASLS
jgi:predicted ATPase/DNA-binding winged helix-turn-helix (wHTH) protein